MLVILDLDQTLVDSRCADALRRARRWSDVYPVIPNCMPYPGVTELLLELGSLDLQTFIVTATPRSYCTRVVQQWGWSIGAERMVCYHDTTQHKPHPAPIQKALQLSGVPASAAMAVGDTPKDTLAARAAGVYSVGALWGAEDPQGLIHSRPESLCRTVAELRALILARHREGS